MGMWLNKVGLPKLIIGCCLLVLTGPLQVAALEISNAPGKIIPVGDVDYHVLCTGSGSSSIILESGLGGNYLDWSLLQPLLSSDQVTVCSYDRAGYGWSSMGNKPRIADKTAAELVTLMQRMEIPRPISFVGHSYGGLIGIALSNQPSKPIDGLIFLDSMHPDQYERFKTDAGVDVPTNPNRAIIFSSPEVISYGLRKEDAKIAYQISRKDKVRSTLYNELRNIKESMNAIRNMKWDLLPSLVLVHGRRDWDAHATDGLMEDVWLSLQTDLAQRSGGEIIIIEGGHQLQLDNPAEVAEKISTFHLGIL
ncbi:MAG: alpha/beta hydrolase [Litorivicinaceae bacterium]|nr:MAG: alpha/beta hydrolase [Litorivicinaceae bacterium]